MDKQEILDENFKDITIQEIGEERLKNYLRGEDNV